MKNIQSYLNEDIGRVPTDQEVHLNAEVEKALDVIADFLKSNDSNDKKETQMTVLNMLSIFDNKFTGKYSDLGETILDTIKRY